MYLVSTYLLVPAVCQVRSCMFEAVLGERGRGRYLIAPDPHQSYFRRMQQMSGCSANIKCNREAGEAMRDADWKDAWPPYPGPQSPCP